MTQPQFIVTRSKRGRQEVIGEAEKLHEALDKMEESLNGPDDGDLGRAAIWVRIYPKP